MLYHQNFIIPLFFKCWSILFKKLSESFKVKDKESVKAQAYWMAQYLDKIWHQANFRRIYVYLKEKP